MWVSTRHWPAIAVVALGVAAYANSFQAPFTFDDIRWISENRLIRSLDAYLFDWSGYRALPNRYVGNLTLALNYRLGQLDVAGYHAFNLAVHVGSALLVYALVIATFQTPRLRASALAPSSRAIAFTAAALFVAHPLQTQAVTYVIQRLTSLATFFYLATVVQYARWRLGRESRSWAWSAARYALLLATALLAMKTKEIAVTLPVAVALYDLAFFGPARGRTLFVLPLLAVALLVPLTLVNVGRPLGEVLDEASRSARVQTALSRGDYLTTQIAVIGTYLRLLVLPVGQNLDHDYPIYRSLLEPRVLASGAVLAGLLALAAFLAARTRQASERALDGAGRLVAFGIGWFFLTLLVESSVIPIVDVIFEHRVYLPSAGIFVAAATALAWGVRRLGRDVTRTTLAAGALIACALAAATFARNRVWADEASLWGDVVAKSPGKARPHLNLGKALFERGDVDGSIDQYLSALALEPAWAEAHNNLGVSYVKKGLIDRAIVHLELATSLEPGYGDAHENLGIAYGRRGWFDRAQQEMSLGLKLNAGDPILAPR